MYSMSAAGMKSTLMQVAMIFVHADTQEGEQIRIKTIFLCVYARKNMKSQRP